MYRMFLIGSAKTEYYSFPWESEGISRIDFAEDLPSAQRLFTVYFYEVVAAMPHIADSDKIIRYISSCRPAVQITRFDDPFSPKRARKVLREAIKCYKDSTERQKSGVELVFEYWKYNIEMILELFWLDIINQKIPPLKQAILAEASRRGVFFLSNGRYSNFISILINIVTPYNKTALHNRELLLFALKNEANRHMVVSGTAGQVIEVEPALLLCHLEIKVSQGFRMESLVAGVGRFVHVMQSILSCKVHCLIGDPVKCHIVSEMVNNMIDACHERTDSQAGYVLFKECRRTERPNITPPNMLLWGTLLNKGKPAELISLVDAYLHSLKAHGQISIYALYQFQQVFMQLLYTVLYQNQVRGHYLFSDDYTIRMYQHATHSIDETLEWCTHVLNKAHEAILAGRDELSLPLRVAKYINGHIDMELTRSNIAKEFNINSDYLGRAFKASTGKTISKYITDKRVDIAKQLLSKGNLSVTDVATSVGYTNLSYFAKVFREATGITPASFAASSRLNRSSADAAYVENAVRAETTDFCK